MKENKRNEFIARQRQKHDYARFILKGRFRYLGHTPKGKEEIAGYSFENNFIVDYRSFQLKRTTIVDATGY